MKRMAKSADLQRLTGDTESRVKWLGDIGAVQSVVMVNGTGNHREYDMRGVLEFLVTSQFRRLGVDGARLGEMMAALRKMHPRWHEVNYLGCRLFNAAMIFHVARNSIELRGRLFDWEAGDGLDPSPIWFNLAALRQRATEAVHG